MNHEEHEGCSSEKKGLPSCLSCSSWFIFSNVVACIVACRATPLSTPEEIAATAVVETKVTLQGTVFGVTFDSEVGSGHYPLKPDRYVLVRTKVPAGVRSGDPAFADEPARGFGFGLHVPLGADGAPARPLPWIGDVVRATGTFRRVSWNGNQVPVLASLTELAVVSGAPPLAEAGATCSVDMDCREHLLCDRASRRCAAPPAGYEWGSAFRGINGACDTDADCPLGQVCDARYTIPSAGDYAAAWTGARDNGRHLCAPEDGATLEKLCPRIATVADLSGGRFAAAKEVCVRGELFLAVLAEDRDTHTQLIVDEPLPYPKADAPYYLFGSTTENAPPYKDPSRPQGAVATPVAKKPVVAVGTVRYDEGHGWWEMHPVKAYLSAP